MRFATGNAPGALGSVDRALGTIGSLPGITDLRATLSAQRVSALIELDRFDEAGRTLRTALTRPDLLGSDELAGYADAAAELAYQQGRWDDALAETSADKAIAALITVRRDDERMAARYLTALSEQPTHASRHGDSAYALLARAAFEERADRPAQALGLLRAVLESSTGYGARHRMILLPTLVRLALDAGDEALAKSAAEAAARQSPLPRSPAIAQWCKGLVDGDADLLSAAAEYLRSAGRVPELAQAVEDLAVLHARTGDETAARKDFGDALAAYTRLGAAWDARRAVARLRTHGIRAGTRSRNRPRTGPQALTETELRVAELVRQGMSNPDIAARLSLSRRTVETHVSHILAKLGAASRREVADLLRGAQRRRLGRAGGYVTRLKLSGTGGCLRTRFGRCWDHGTNMKETDDDHHIAWLRAGHHRSSPQALAGGPHADDLRPALQRPAPHPAQLDLRRLAGRRGPDAGDHGPRRAAPGHAQRRSADAAPVAVHGGPADRHRPLQGPRRAAPGDRAGNRCWRRSSPPSPLEQLLDRAAAVVGALRGLSEVHRTALVQVYLMDRTVPEAAAARLCRAP